MSTINAPTDNTVRQMMRDTEELKTRVNYLQNLIPQLRIPNQTLELGKVTSTQTGEQNVQAVESATVAFDQTTEARDVQAPLKGHREARNTCHPGGFNFETNDLVWRILVGDAFYSTMRAEGQVWMGTTTSTIPANSNGTANIIKSDGSTISATVTDRYNEDIGSGVIVFGAYMPDGKNYILTAACEESTDAGGPIYPQPVI